MMAKRAKVFVEIEISMNTFAVREEVEKALQVRLGIITHATQSTSWMWTGAQVLMIVPQEDKSNA